ncbi:YbjP/YqhG family protein [Caballeronia sp. LjRoot34]|uniref:DUF3828 domain-containing protein n=1 Tax=Caballeronia sp. LjRoot34 TaxID=3342325 RepID=UPI003ECF855B
MRANIFRAILVAWAVLGAQSAFAQSVDSARQFLTGIYATYTKDGTPPRFSGVGSNAIVSPSLVKLIKRDQRVLRGEAGVLDMDPLCRCQDFDLKTTGVAVTMLARLKAAGTVSFENLGSRHEVTFSLVWSGGGWRIDDIREGNQPSLRRALRAEIQEYADKTQ